AGTGALRGAQADRGEPAPQRRQRGGKAGEGRAPGTAADRGAGADPAAGNPGGGICRGLEARAALAGGDCSRDELSAAEPSADGGRGTGRRAGRDRRRAVGLFAGGRTLETAVDWSM